MSKLVRAAALAAMLAAMNLAGVTAVAPQAHTTDQATRQDAWRPPSDRQISKAQHQRRVPSPEQAAADAAHLRLLLAEQRSSIPNAAPAHAISPMRPADPSGQAGWLAPALGVLAVVLALVAGVAVRAARRTNRTQRAGRTA
jgi:hypothetical protein